MPTTRRIRPSRVTTVPPNRLRRYAWEPFERTVTPTTTRRR